MLAADTSGGCVSAELVGAGAGNDEAGEAPECRWSELGILETEMLEKCHVRRASLPAGQSTILPSSSSVSPSSSSAQALAVSQTLIGGGGAGGGGGEKEREREESEFQEESLKTSIADNNKEASVSVASSLPDRSSDDAFDTTLLPMPSQLQRRESLPFNFPERGGFRRGGGGDWIGGRQGRRESLPARGSAPATSDDLRAELNITSIAPFHLPVVKKEKKLLRSGATPTSSSSCSASPSSGGQHPSAGMPTSNCVADHRMDFDFCPNDEKENVIVDGNGNAPFNFVRSFAGFP